MKILVLQHIPIEDPGYIKVLMQQDQYELTTIELDAGEKIPNNLAEFDAMLCMGGPMDTWMEAEYPWLIEEKIKIKEFVCDLEKPFLGFCLGAQLLGEVLGGKVVKSNPPEIIFICKASRPFSCYHKIGVGFGYSFANLQAKAMGSRASIKTLI